MRLKVESSGTAYPQARLTDALVELGVADRLAVPAVRDSFLRPIRNTGRGKRRETGRETGRNRLVSLLSIRDTGPKKERKEAGKNL